MAFQHLKGACKKERERLLAWASSDSTRGNGFKLKEEGFRIDIKKKFCTQRIVRQQNRFSIEVVDAASLELFKATLDGALSNLI